jgi:outer membrane protein, heavy metal efflux system
MELTKKILYIALGALGAVRLAGAAATDPAPLTLNDCLALALRQNPLVLSSAAQYQASLARVHQAAAFPQPVLSLDSDLQPGPFNFRRSGESYIGISQTVEFPGKRMLRREIASRESEEMLADTEILRLDLEFQVKEAFYGLLLAGEKVKYAGQDLDLSRDFQNKAEIKLAAGDVADVEVLRARVEASKAANALVVARSERRLAAARLNYLLARPKPDPLEIRGEIKTPSVPLDADELKRRAMTSRPELKQIKSSLEKESLRKTQAYWGYLPDFDLGISRHRISGEKKTWDFTIAMPIPLFFWQPKAGPIAEAEANLVSLKRQEAHLINTVELEVEEACLNAASAGDQIKLFEEGILGQAEEVYRVFLFRFEGGEIGGIELIEARRSLLEARKAYADALFNYDVTIAALEKSVGMPLERGHNE